MEDSQDEASIIRGVMIQKKEALGLIKRKMIQLEEDLIRFAAAHLPHKHNLLPSEILGRIFILAAQDHGAVAFPLSKIPSKSPPQLTVSQVCSHWRMVAFRTSELWSNTSLHYPEDENLSTIHLHQRWLRRAGTIPVTLSMAFAESLNLPEIAWALERILFPLQVKRLLLNMNYEQFVALWDLSDAVLSHVQGVELDLTVREGEGSMDISSPHHLLTRLRSVKLRGDDMARCLDKLSLILPWSQLRCLEYHVDIEGLQPVVDVLRQIPMLQRLVLTTLETDIAPKEPTMPSLQEFYLEICDEMVDGMELEKILRGFTFPSLIKFGLSINAYWTSEIFEILKRQYNLQLLQWVGFLGGFILPVSSVLYNSPMLRSLHLERDAIFDDEAIAGISNGTLGQFLKMLKRCSEWRKHARKQLLGSLKMVARGKRKSQF